MLRTDGLTKTFGGLSAVNDVNLEVEKGEFCSIIGPNGAGKTTFFNLLTGELQPTSGRVEFAGGGEMRDITDYETYETARAGIHRSYQITNTFPTVTVLENVRLAVQAHSGHDRLNAWRNRRTFDEHYRRTHEILERVGLADEEEIIAENLSHGQKRNLEIGVALAGDPELLLLDEPTAGVSSEGVDELVDFITDIATDHTIIMIEHNMDLVMDMSERIVVLHQGEVIADGPPAEIQEDEAVRRAYLGSFGDEEEASG